MNTCPVCGAQLDSMVCACGYDRSRDYTSYPTLAPLPPGLPTFESLYAVEPEPRMARVKCTKCGQEATIYENDFWPSCSNCDYFLNPEDMLKTYRNCFYSALSASDKNSERSLNGLVNSAMEIMSNDLFRYADSATAQDLAEKFSILSERPESLGFTLPDYVRILGFRDYAYSASLMIRNNDIGHNIFDEQEEESRALQWSHNEIARSAGFRYYRGTWHYTPFNADEYRRHTQSQLYRDAAAAEAKGDYQTAHQILSHHWNDGCPLDPNPYALTRLALLWHYGWGCEQDRGMAADSFTIAAEIGSPLAAAWISEYYRMGYVVEKDKVFSRKLYAAVDPELQKMCEAGDADAQYFRGYNLVYGINIENDSKTGVELLLQALHQGHRSAAVELAYCFYDGDGVAKDYAAAFTLLTEYPVRSDSRKGQYLLGLCYYWGNGTEQDHGKAFSCFKRAAELGHGRSKDYLGDCYRLGVGTEKDYAEAVKWYHDAADNHGITNSAYYLGFLYANGRGVAQNWFTAVRYLKIAAEDGYENAQDHLGYAYEYGKGVVANTETSRYWYQKAADAGLPSAQFSLGYSYLTDDDLTLHQKGLVLLTQSAEAGYDLAQYKLGHLYELGYGVPTDHTKAIEWYQKAAAQGHADALYAAGRLYMEGKGTARDPDKGIEYLTKAADAGHKSAARELAEHYHRGITDNQGYFRMSPELARKYATLAAEDKTDGKAQYLMGHIIHYDLHDPDPEGAIDWYRKAIQNECPEAKLELCKALIQLKQDLDEVWQLLQSDSIPQTAEMYYLRSLCLENGWGTPKNKRLAKQYYNTAIEKGYVDTAKKKKRFGLF